jgi:glycosyltransferase involved in cell wall biosynthesis
LAKVCILTSAHQATDSRIFHKEAVSLARGGHQVELLAPDAEFKDDHWVDGVLVRPLRRSKGRLFRGPLSRGRRWLELLARALASKADVYHFHDPELLPLGLILKRLTGARVIYDSHETLAHVVLARQYIPERLRKMVSRAMRWAEPRLARTLDAVIVTNEESTALFPGAHRLCVLYNYVDTDLFAPAPEAQREEQIIYVAGRLGRSQGLMTVAHAFARVHGGRPTARLMLIGDIPDVQVKMEFDTILQEGGAREAVTLLGRIPHREVVAHIQRSAVGLFAGLDVPNHVLATPIKLFEYMACGIPVVASNYGFLDQYVTEPGAGLLFDPRSAESLAEALDYLLGHPDEAAAMGARGLAIVQREWNWRAMERRLLALYEGLLGEEETKNDLDSIGDRSSLGRS